MKNNDLTEIKKYNFNRDYMVDVIRVIACMIVVLVHTNDLGMDFVDKGRIFWGVVLGDGVTMFFMMTGFFLFKNKSCRKLWKKTILGILLPSLAVLIFSELFFDVVACKMSFNEWLQNYSFDFKEFIKNILGFRAPESCSHLWYIFTYIKIIIFFPILKAIVDNKKALRYCTFVSLGVLIYKDLNLFVEPEYSLSTFYFFEIPVMYILIGNVLYSYKDRIKNNRKLSFIFVVLLVIAEIVRYIMQYIMFERNLGNNRYIYWDSSFACICSSLFILLILSLDIKNKRVGESVSFIGQRTFTIYLIHPLVIAFLGGMKFRDWVLNKLGYVQDTMDKMTFVSEVFYIGFRFIVEFAISFGLAVLFWKIKKMIIKVSKKIRESQIFISKIKKVKEVRDKMYKSLKKA